MKEKKHHYTYVIINQKNGKMYIGTRSCNCEPMFDLGVVYFSSSYDKEFMKEQKEHSENFSYQVLIEEESRDKAMEMEIELHCFHDVAKNESFYNKSRQLSAGFDNGGIGPMLGKHHSEESKAKISKATKGRKKSKETRKRMSEGMRGRVRSKEHCENISKAASKRVGWKHSEETKKKISESQKGKTLSPEHVKNISKDRGGRVRMNDGVKNISPRREGVEELKNEGWALGWNVPSFCKSRKWMNDGIKSKMVKEEDRQEFIDNGWIEGRVKFR